MAKLASAREGRMYGPRLSRNRAEYTNAGLYVFATVLLLSGFAAEFSREPRSGLVLMLMAAALFVIVNAHDILAHLAAIDFRFSLMGFDVQLALVEFAVPAVQVLGSVLWFIGILFLFIQEEKGYGYFKLEKHALGMLVAGPILWVLGSLQNSCQFYERADGHVQILQQCVHIPFLLGSVLFLVGAILNSREQAGSYRHGLDVLMIIARICCLLGFLLNHPHGHKHDHSELIVQGMTWIWLGLFGSLLFLIGGLANVTKVFKMQQASGLRLEKLRGGAQERLVEEREGQLPLIRGEERTKLQEDRDRVGRAAEQRTTAAIATSPAPYKDVLLGRH